MSHKSGTSYYVTDKDCETAFAQCKSCEFIADNKNYRSIVESTYLTVRDTDDINASCGRLTDDVRNYLNQYYPVVDWNQYTHILSIYTGMLRWVNMLAHVCEYIDRTHKMGEAKKMLVWASARLTSFEAGSDFAQRFIDEFSIQCDGHREEVVRMYAIAILVGLIGHELGHACLGHIGTPEQNSVSRNNERCADMFASSVAQSIGNGYAGAIGAVVLDVSFVWLSGKHSEYVTNGSARKNKFMSHPVSVDRVKAFIESFNTMLVTSPVTAKMLMKLMKAG